VDEETMTKIFGDMGHYHKGPERQGGQLRLLIFGLVVGSMWFGYAMMKYKMPEGIRGTDTRVFYHAALGDPDDWAVHQPFNRPTVAPVGWLYKDYVKPIFLPLTWFSEDTAVYVHLAVNMGCYLLLVWLVLNVPFGWIPVLLTIPPAIQSMTAGNLGGILALSVLNPWTALLGGFVKPYLLVFVAIVALRRLVESKSHTEA
jgi:hypothetical protein